MNQSGSAAALARPVISFYDGESDAGYRSFFVMMPEKKAAAVVLSHCDFAPTGNIAIAVLFLALGLEPPPVPEPPIRAVIGKTIGEKGSVSLRV